MDDLIVVIIGVGVALIILSLLAGRFRRRQTSGRSDEHRAPRRDKADELAQRVEP